MEDHVQVYKTKAEKYERLISREDYLNIIPITLKEICSFENADIIDLGAGTGRLTCLFAPKAKSMTAFDLSQHMLNVTAEKLTRMGLKNWKTSVADHRTLPVKNGSADIVMAGWSISYVAIPNDTNWQDNIFQVISEMKRVVRPGGTLIILETLGTGNETSQTHDFLKGYFDLLENKYGFSHRWIRTDYRFESVEVAEELTRFFFNDELADRIVRQELTIVPECTGVWWSRL